MVDIDSDPGWKFLKVSSEQSIQDANKPFDVKKNVWIPDAEEGFLAAEIKATKGDLITVMSTKGNEVNTQLFLFSQQR